MKKLQKKKTHQQGYHYPLGDCFTDHICFSVNCQTGFSQLISWHVPCRLSVSLTSSLIIVLPMNSIKSHLISGLRQGFYHDILQRRTYLALAFLRYLGIFSSFVFVVYLLP